MMFKKKTQEQISKLSPDELRIYMNSFRLFNEKKKDAEWKKMSREEKKKSILSDYEFIINKRGIEGITLEEQIEFALNNKPSEKANYVTSLVEHYHSIKKSEKFTFFWETKSPFSQWYKSSFTASTCLIEGVCMNKIKREYVLQDQFHYSDQEYSSAEQFMMYHKAIIFLDIDSAKKIMKTNNVRKIKELGRNVSEFNEEVWKYYRSKVVYEGNKAKFTQNKQIKNKLLSTAGTTIVEASPNDKIWGIGLAENDIRAQKRETWQGKNLLGEILTKIRMEILEKY